MKNLLYTFIAFFLGCFCLLLSGADGTWESLNPLGWFGLVIINLTVLSVVIGIIINKIKK